MAPGITLLTIVSLLFLEIESEISFITNDTQMTLTEVQVVILGKQARGVFLLVK